MLPIEKRESDQCVALLKQLWISRGVFEINLDTHALIPLFYLVKLVFVGDLVDSLFLQFSLLLNSEFS